MQSRTTLLRSSSVVGYFSTVQGRRSSVLIHFGYPQAHEDDAERAVQVGLGVSFANTVSRSCSPASGGAHFTSTPASADWPIEKRTCWPSRRRI